MEYLSDRGVDLAQFKTETYYDTQDKQGDKEFEPTKGPHCARWRIEEKDDQNVNNGYSAPGD